MIGHDEGLKSLIDLTAASVALGAFVQFLPPAAAILTIIWTLIRILESPTIRYLVLKNFKRDIQPWHTTPNITDNITSVIKNEKGNKGASGPNETQKK